MNIKPEISVIIPLYNEEENFAALVSRLDELILKFKYRIEIVLVDDGSTDNTTNLMINTSLNKTYYTCLILSRNFGHQAALTAGLIHASGTEGIMIIDGDLQDPPELLIEFYDLYKKGFDIIYGIRKSRKENILKRFSYKFFYRILNKISIINIPLDSGDFCFLSRKVVNHINRMPEESRYLRGMRAWIGFSQYGLPYEREKRKNGVSKYTIKKLLNLAYNGIFNFSEFPIKFITQFGLGSIFISLIYFVYVFFRKVFIKDVPIGFTSTIFIIVFLSGVQLLSISILGEYILRIFFQVKKRPLFIIKTKISEGNLES